MARSTHQAAMVKAFAQANRSATTPVGSCLESEDSDSEREAAKPVGKALSDTGGYETSAAGLRDRLISEQQDSVLEENMELYERVDVLEKELLESHRELEATRRQLAELEEENMARRASAKARRSKAWRSEEPPSEPHADLAALEALRREEGLQEAALEELRARLQEEEERHSAARAESSSLACKLAESRQEERLKGTELQEARRALAEAQRTLVRERDVLRQTREERCELAEEVRKVKVSTEARKMVLGHQKSLVESMEEEEDEDAALKTPSSASSTSRPARAPRKGNRFVTMDLMSQLKEAPASSDEDEDCDEAAETEEGKGGGAQEACQAKAEQAEQAGRGSGGGPDVGGGPPGLVEQLAQARDQEAELRRTIQELQQRVGDAQARPPPSFWDFLPSALCGGRSAMRQAAPAAPPQLFGAAGAAPQAREPPAGTAKAPACPQHAEVAA